MLWHLTKPTKNLNNDKYFYLTSLNKVMQDD